MVEVPTGRHRNSGHPHSYPPARHGGDVKLTEYFDNFMKNTVNIDASRLRDLDERVETLYSVLRGHSDLGAMVLGKKPQGSWAHETIIRPLEGNEFDADFMLCIREQAGWTPAQYIDAIYVALRSHGTYKDKVEKKNRCVRVVYANDCHIDIVPFIELADGRKVIACSETDEWEETDPDAFTAWMKKQDDTAQGNLRRVIRLMKYLRDHHMHFKTSRSVILTILLGERVSAVNKLDRPNCYGDLPTAFVHIVEDLRDWMDARPNLPPLPDPSGANNDFDHRWNQSSYDNLRAKVEQIAADARAALDAAGTDDSHALWKKVFGDDFKKPPPQGNGARLGSGAVLPSVQSGRDG